MAITKRDLQKYDFDDELTVKFTLYGKQMIRIGTYQGYGIDTLTLQTAEGMAYIPIKKILNIAKRTIP